MTRTDFHIHTNITDGKMTIVKVIQLARKLKIKEIAFTEHISKTPNYNWMEFRKKIKDAIPLNLPVLIGVEAKVLNKRGDLNVESPILNKADIILGAVHGKGDVIWLLNSPCHIIAHPPINDKNIHYFKKCKKIIEINPKKKYRLPYYIIQKLINMDTRFSFGSNAHTPKDLEMGQRYLKTIKTKFPEIHIINANEVKNNLILK